jgi:hypothetical protein
VPLGSIPLRWSCIFAKRTLDFYLLLHIDPPRLSLLSLSPGGAPVRRRWRSRKWSTRPAAAALQCVGHVPGGGCCEALALGVGTRPAAALQHPAELLPCGEGTHRVGCWTEINRGEGTADASARRYSLAPWLLHRKARWSSPRPHVVELARAIAITVIELKVHGRWSGHRPCLSVASERPTLHILGPRDPQPDPAREGSAPHGRSTGGAGVLCQRKRERERRETKMIYMEKKIKI